MCVSHYKVSQVFLFGPFACNRPLFMATNLLFTLSPPRPESGRSVPMAFLSFLSTNAPPIVPSSVPALSFFFEQAASFQALPRRDHRPNQAADQSQPHVIVRPRTSISCPFPRTPFRRHPSGGGVSPCPCPRETPRRTTCSPSRPHSLLPWPEQEVSQSPRYIPAPGREMGVGAVPVRDPYAVERCRVPQWSLIMQ